MVGDVKKSSYGYLQTLGGLTPVPGGVGQCTVIALMENVIQIAEENEYVYGQWNVSILNDVIIRD